MTSFYDLLKYAATGIASPDMTYYDKMRASTLMGGAVQTLTGIPPLTFNANGKPLVSWSMKGNGSQTGTPTHDNPVMPTFCGKLVGADWTIPISCAGQTVPVYLGQTHTVRRIEKLVLTGEETWDNIFDRTLFGVQKLLNSEPFIPQVTAYCTQYIYNPIQSGLSANMVNGEFALQRSLTAYNLFIRNTDYSTASDFKSYLTQQYANGTPVTIWYVLAEPETTISNEPLAKIGDYADELSSADAAVTIPTIKGQNTLTVETELQPSEMTITFKG